MPKVQQLLIEAFACVAKREAHKIFKPAQTQFTAMRKGKNANEMLHRLVDAIRNGKDWELNKS